MHVFFIKTKNDVVQSHYAWNFNETPNFWLKSDDGSDKSLPCLPQIALFT